MCLCSNSTNIIPRLAEANPRIPAYLHSALAWGAQPIAVLRRPPASGRALMLLLCNMAQRCAAD